MTARLTFGIDPGVSGAVAVMHDDRVHAVHDLPTVARLVGKKNAQMIDGATLTSLLRDEISLCPGATVSAVLEEVRPMPSTKDGKSMGSTSAFQFGRTLGKIEGILDARRIPYMYITPQGWKKEYGLIKAPKDASRTLAIQRHPEIAHQLKRKKDHNRAEAVLIAKFGAQQAAA